MISIVGVRPSPSDHDACIPFPVASLPIRRRRSLGAARVGTNSPLGGYAAVRVPRSPIEVLDRMKRRFVVRWAPIVAAGFAIFVGDGVVARGPNVGSPYDILVPGFLRTPRFDAPAERPRSQRTFAEGPPVCVRLCDGAFFPISTAAGYPSAEAACQDLCPDAPTAVYRETSGSDGIEDAISASGESYAALPFAFRYRTTFDATCACHRAVAPRYSVALDPTLRRGDFVMTAKGPVVFEGDRNLPHLSNDFTAVADAKIPPNERIALQTIGGPDAPALSASIATAPPPSSGPWRHSRHGRWPRF